MKHEQSRFAEAVELLQQFEPTDRRNDKRRAKRLELRVPIQINLVAQDNNSTWLKAELRDVSPRGLRMMTSLEMEIGQTFVVRFPNKDGKELAAPLLCRVAHTGVEGKVNFLIGAEFIGHVQSMPANKTADQAALDKIRHSILD